MTGGYTAPCRACRAAIVFIRLPSGKNMPCDSRAVFYKKTDDGRGAILYKKTGTQIRGEVVESREEADGIAWRPHWSSCTGAKRYKDPKKIRCGVGEIPAKPVPEAPKAEPVQADTWEQLSMFERRERFNHPE